MTDPVREALAELVAHLHEGDWNLRAPQEMADMIADKIESALARAALAEPEEEREAPGMVLVPEDDHAE